LLHYPPVAPNAPGDLYGSAPHVDYGGVTLLTHDGTPGLEVLIDGRWTAVEPVEGAIVVNCGQMLERASNGRLLPTAHRVHNRGGTDRWSAAFFLDPHVDTMIAPVPCCVDETDPPRFEPVVFGDVVRAELSASFEHHAGLIGR
jgi:isopenicillin N synthase-like dioxygenase